MSKSIRSITVQINPAVSSDTSLTEAATALGYGSYTAFPVSTWGTTSTWTGAIIDWLTRWHWDPVNKKGYMMCKEAESTGDGNHKLIVYTESSNSFSMVYDARLTTGGGTGTGHGYDCGAIDPATGDFYFLPLYAENVIKYDGAGGWTVATGNVTGGTGSDSSGPRNISWHPNLYGSGSGGLVQSRGNALRAWQKSSGASGTWASIGSVIHSSIRYGQGVYCSALDMTISSCGTAGLEAYMTYGGTTPAAGRMPNDLPLSCSSSAGDTTMARMMPTPGGSVCILESATPGRVWRFNTSTFAWDLQGFTHPLRLINNSWPTMYLSTYGIYWALRENNGGLSQPDSILWRPPALAASGVTF